MLAQLVTVLLFAVAIRAEDICDPDVKWVAFTGSIPENAFKAATDKDGNPIYLGAIQRDFGGVGGIILHDSHDLHYSIAGEELHTSEGVKILCTDHPDEFKWNDGFGDEGYLISIGQFQNYVIRNADEHSQLGALNAVLADAPSTTHLLVNDETPIENYQLLASNVCNEYLTHTHSI